MAKLAALPENQAHDMAKLDALTAITSLAVAAFRSRETPASMQLRAQMLGTFGEPLVNEAIGFSIMADPLASHEEDVASILSEPDLSALSPKEGELDPFVLTEGAGGVRLNASNLLMSLMTAALQQIFFLRLPEDEGTFVRQVLENFAELRRAVRGEKVRAYQIVAFGGVRLPPHGSINTPWGTIRQAPEVTHFRPTWGFVRRTTLLLAIPAQVSVKFDRSPQPQMVEWPSQTVRDRAILMMPLAFTLATSPVAAPTVTWYTTLGPFASGFSHSSPFVMALPGEIELTPTDVSQVENWCRIVEERHAAAIDVSARRLVSAVVHRLDPADKLIDSVMVWENLVGTRTESTFRVTGALVKLLESDRSKRVALRKELVELYNVRSRVVHGDVVEDRSVADAADRALQYAVKGLKQFYADRASWLSLTSQERADRLLLEEP